MEKSMITKEQYRKIGMMHNSKVGHFGLGIWDPRSQIPDPDILTTGLLFLNFFFEFKYFENISSINLQ